VEDWLEGVHGTGCCDDFLHVFMLVAYSSALELVDFVYFRWPMVIFYDILDVLAINAIVI